MKTPFIVVARVVLALALAPASNPCHAGSVTYNFTEFTGAPNPGEIGATITMASPPASPTSPWSAPGVGDINDILIIDPALFPNGFTGEFPITSVGSQITSNGPILLGGIIISMPQLLEIEIFETDTFFADIHEGVGNFVDGTWIASQTVPEPASAVLAGSASAIGLALAAFRKRKEARRQRPVGPLDANQ